MRFTVTELLAATRGNLRAGDPSSHCDGFWFDSRTLPSGSCFVPVVAERDGHDFIPAAFSAGAAGTLTSRPGVVAGDFVIEVDDTVAALERVATEARRRIPRAIGITGSAGKTTTKDLLAHVLAGDRVVGRAEASFNNEIGVPLTIANAPDDAAVVVAEVGSRGIGHVAAACEVLAPDVAVVTIVGTAHIGVFGSQDEIAQGKGELVEALGPDGTAVLNADDERVDKMAARTTAAVLRYGIGPALGVDVTAGDLGYDDDLTARFRLVTPTGAAACRLPAAGAHIVSCALAAAAAAHVEGVDVATIADRLGDAPRSAHRMAVEHGAGGWFVLNDAYNANREAMLAAIASASRLAEAQDGRLLALVGHMAELGDHAPEIHEEVGAALVDAGAVAVVGVGVHAELFAGVVAADPASGAALLRELAGGFEPGDVVLVKASRVVGLESAVPLLIADPERTAP